MIRIKYNNIEGVLNIDTREVMFYQFKYSCILEAIQKLEHDLKAHEKEIKIFDELLNDLFIISN